MGLEFDTDRILGRIPGNYVVAQDRGLIRMFIASWGVDSQGENKTILTPKLPSAKRFSWEDARRTRGLMQARNMEAIHIYEITEAGYLKKATK